MANAIKKVIDEHPLVTLVSVAVSAVAVAAGASTWLSEKRLIAHTEHHRFELAHLAAAAKAEQQESEQGLKRTIAELTGRVTSIERKLGDDRSFLDLRKLLTPRTELSRLDRTSYQSFFDGRFFVNVPKVAGWQYSVTGDIGSARAAYGDKFVNLLVPAEMAVVADVNKGALWAGPELGTAEVLFKPINEPISMSLRPVLHVMPFGTNEISSLLRAVGELLANQTRAEPGDATPMEILELRESSSAARTSTDPGRIMDYVDSMSRVARGDLAAFLLTDSAFQRVVRATMFDQTIVEISHMQKIGNLFYLQFQTMIERVKLSNGDEAGKLFIVEEIIYLSNPSRPSEAILVRTFLPSFDGNPESAGWVSLFLSSLMVPF